MKVKIDMEQFLLEPVIGTKITHRATVDKDAPGDRHT